MINNSLNSNPTLCFIGANERLMTSSTVASAGIRPGNCGSISSESISELYKALRCDISSGSGINLIRCKKSVFRFVLYLIFLFSCQQVISQSPGGVSANLQLWLRADIGTSCTTNGCFISQWNDQSGANNNATQATAGFQPTILANSKNFNPGIAFDGADDKLVVVGQNFQGNTSVTHFGVLNSNTIINNFSFYYEDFGILLFTESPGSINWGYFNWDIGTIDFSTNNLFGAGSTILTFKGDNTSPGLGYMNGYLYLTGASQLVSTVLGTALDVNIGTWNFNSNYFTGDITEIIRYNRRLSAQEQQRVDSYLAIKYGILVQGTVITYLNSVGASVFFSDDGANGGTAIDGTADWVDVAGIARDDNSLLDQRVSKSQSASGALTVATDNDFTSINRSNARTQLSDGQFLVWGNDGNVIGTSKVTDLDNAVYASRTLREWKIQNTGSVGSVNLKFDNLYATSGTYHLLSDVDGDFTSGATSIGTSSDGIFTNITIPPGTTFLTVADIASAGPFLSVSKVENYTPNLVVPGSDVRYTVTIQNTGTQTGTNISAIDVIDTDFGSPYNITFNNCGAAPGSSFTAPNLSFTNMSVTTGQIGTITYDVEVNIGTVPGETLSNSIDVSAAMEGGNNPSPVSADILTVADCGAGGTVNIAISVTTDAYGYETYWELTPAANACGFGTIFAGGNMLVGCGGGGLQIQAPGGYPSNTQINEGAWALADNTSYAISVVDDWGDSGPGFIVFQDGIPTDNFIMAAGANEKFIFNIPGAALPAVCTDASSPNVTVNQATGQADPTSINSATFEVIFDEPISVSTFTAGDISVSGTTGTVTSGPTEISPNDGTSFEFIVSGMTSGDIVTATIPAGGIEDFATNTNTASTSTDNQISYIVPAGPGGVITNLQLWLRADAGTSCLTNGCLISQWNDQSGNNNNAIQVTGTRQPVLASNSANFHPSITFDGNSDFLDIPYHADLNSTNQTIFSVHRDNGGTYFKSPYTSRAAAGAGQQDQGYILYVRAVAEGGMYTFWTGYSTFWNFLQSTRSSSGIFEIVESDATAGTGNSVQNLRVDEIYIAGYTTATYVNQSAVYSNPYRVGAGASESAAGSFFWNGEISEQIVYDRILTVTERLRASSYLALKHGITLSSDYLASDAGVRWNSTINTVFHNDVAGIGRDDVGTLNQKQSKSINPGALLAIYSGNETGGAYPAGNKDNVNSFTADMSFLIWGNDNADATSWTETELSPYGGLRIAREWLVNEKGIDTDTVTLVIRDADLPSALNAAGKDLYFISDTTDADFISGTKYTRMLYNAAEGTWEVALNLKDETYFTFGYDLIPTRFMRHGKFFNQGIRRPFYWIKN